MREFNQRMVLTNIPRTLSVPHDTREEDEEQTNHRYGLVQTQVHHPAQGNTSRPNCQGNQ